MEMTTVNRICPLCGCSHSRAFDKKQLEAGIRMYKAGAHIQDAFPSFTPDEREFLLTGICCTCWDDTFGI